MSDWLFGLLFACWLLFSGYLLLFVNELVGSICLITGSTVFFIVAIILEEREEACE